MAKKSDAGQIQHVIVVMLENRSYDNVLGSLYMNSKPPCHQSNLNGLTGKETNPDPKHPSDSSKDIQVANRTTTQLGGEPPSYPGTAIPLVDPGEYFKDMAQQITGASTIPATNPYVSWPPPDKSKLMKGFTLNYAALDGDFQQQPPAENVPDVMNYLMPDQVPVSAFLARNFAVCDQWCASVPTQTFTNRSFGHCAAPGVRHMTKKGQKVFYSLVDDIQYGEPDAVDLPSIFSRLDAMYCPAPGAAPNWKVYFHDYSISMLTVPYVKQAAKRKDNVNVATYDNSDWGTVTPHHLGGNPSTFIEDLQNGTLPRYSFIEPRYSATYAAKHGGSSVQQPPNSNHPGGRNYLDAKVNEVYHNYPIDVASGELFLMELYNLLHNNKQIWNQTLLIITYDEHGGIYEHEPPQKGATSPGTINWSPSPLEVTAIPPAGDKADTTADGFDFTVYGGRVPAIVASPFVKAGSTIRSKKGPFDHASIVKTVWDIFKLSSTAPPPAVTSLNQRDAAAPSLVDFLHDNPVNHTGAYTGRILVGPASLTFYHHHGLSQAAKQMLYAGCFPADSSKPLTATVTSGADWLFPSTSLINGNSTLAVEVSVTPPSKADVYVGEIQITAGGATPVNIPVTLTVHEL